MRASVVGNALTEAVGTRGGHVAGAVVHADRSSRHASSEYGDLCAESRGNAPVESFFATLKKELVHRTTFRTHAEARIAIRHWIESWHNHRRRSSVIGYQTPIGWENHYRHNTRTLTAQ